MRFQIWRIRLGGRLRWVAVQTSLNSNQNVEKKYMKMSVRQILNLLCGTYMRLRLDCLKQMKNRRLWVSETEKFCTIKLYIKMGELQTKQVRRWEYYYTVTPGTLWFPFYFWIRGQLLFLFLPQHLCYYDTFTF